MKRLNETCGKTLAGCLILLACGMAGAVPDWRLTDLQGRSIGPADFAGEWVVVNYWATWCKPCREEMPVLDGIASRNDHVTVLGIAWEDTRPVELERFLERLPVSYPILRADPFDPPPDVEAPRVLPMTLVFGPDGQLVERFQGPVSHSDIQSIVDREDAKTGGEP